MPEKSLRKLLQELGKQEKQFSDYGETVKFIIFRRKKEARRIVKNLLNYLRHNQDVRINRIALIPWKVYHSEDRHFKIFYRCECSWCGEMFEDWTNIINWWSPARPEEKPVCEPCYEKAVERGT